MSDNAKLALFILAALVTAPVVALVAAMLVGSPNASGAIQWIVMIVWVGAGIWFGVRRWSS